MHGLILILTEKKRKHKIKERERMESIDCPRSIQDIYPFLITLDHLIHIRRNFALDSMRER